MSEEDPEKQLAGSPSSGRAATVISQTYYYVVAAIGLIFLLGGTIAALIALRKWLLPVSDEAASSFFGPPADAHDAARSFLGALAFAIPGALVFAWHLREARRREGRGGFRVSWGGVLYFHLVAFISLLIALGGVIAMLHALRDSVVPFCYDTPSFEVPPVEDPNLQGEGTPIPDIEIPADSPLLESEDCYPTRSEALRSTLDAGIVASVAGGVWVWHLRRGRRSAGDAPDEG